MENLPREIPVRWNNEIIGYTLDKDSCMSGCIRVTDKELWEKLLKEHSHNIYISSRSIGEVKKGDKGIDFVYNEERKEFCILNPIIK